MGSSLDAPFFRLYRILGFAAAAGQRPQQRVRQRRRIARLATSARRTRTATAAPFAAPRRSRLPCRADASPASATPTRLDRDATNASALAPGARAPQVEATASKPR